MSEKILVIDDEHEITDLIELYLKNEDYTVFKFYSPAEALDFIGETEVDLAILDIMMPEINGFELCRRIREKYTYPIIMLTAKDEETDKITGLTLGADDYITKPFRPLEMVARVKAQLRRYKRYNTIRSSGSGSSEEIFTHADLMLNPGTHECYLGDEPLSLTPTEFTILQILLSRKGSAVSAEELFHEIWKDEYYTKSNNTITVHIRHLREKLGDSADESRYIKTIWGVGYKIEN